MVHSIQMSLSRLWVICGARASLGARTKQTGLNGSRFPGALRKEVMSGQLTLEPWSVWTAKSSVQRQVPTNDMHDVFTSAQPGRGHVWNVCRLHNSPPVRPQNFSVPSYSNFVVCAGRLACIARLCMSIMVRIVVSTLHVND